MLLEPLTNDAAEATMDANVVQVWMRPLGRACKFRVGRLDDASWFRARLRDMGYNCSKVVRVSGTDQAVLIVTLEGTTFPELQETEAGIPDVQIMLDPA